MYATTVRANENSPAKDLSDVYKWRSVKMGGGVEIEFVLPNPRLWSTDSPHLYVIETVVKPCGDPVRLVLYAQRQNFQAHRQDTLPIEVSVVDANGLIVNNSNALIHFVVNGSARIVGVESGDPASHESVKRPYRRAFHGRALLLVQSLRSETIEVTAESDGLAKGVLSLVAGKIIDSATTTAVAGLEQKSEDGTSTLAVA